jgi:hypothetical protein
MPGPLPVVFLRFQQPAGTGDPKPIAGSYDVDAAFMSFQLHDGGIHAVRAGAGGAGVMEVSFQCMAGRDGLPTDVSGAHPR